MRTKTQICRDWTPTATMLLVSLISYVDRNTLALLAPTIMRETRLTGEQYGFIVSAFSIVYMMGNPVWGRILDRIGLRAGMTAAVSCWTAASVAHAFAGGFWGFAAARAALGFGEGATFPGGLRAVVQSLPPDRRGRGIAVAYSGGSLGAIITPLVITPVFLWGGWRPAFWFTGMVGAGWLLLWAVVSRRPDMRRKPAPGALPAGGPHWRDRHLWAFISAYALGALPIGFVLYGAAIYLAQALGKPQAFIGRVLWIPPLGWEAGYFFWGWLSDRALRTADSPAAALRPLMAAATAFTLPLALLSRTPDARIVMAGLFCEMFVAAGFIILPVAYATRVYPPAHAGMIAGVGAGSWGASVAIAMPGLGRLFDLHRWDAAFGVAAFVPVLGFAGWWWLSRKTRAQAAETSMA